MKKFAFRLSGFLRIKEFEEKNAWNEVLKQQGRLANIRNRIETLQSGVLESRENLSNSQMDGNLVARWQLAQESILGLNAQIEVLEKEYALEAKTLEKLVARHRETKKEAKIIENYKERKKTEFFEEKNKLIEIQRNEFANQSFMRKLK